MWFRRLNTSILREKRGQMSQKNKITRYGKLIGKRNHAQVETNSTSSRKRRKVHKQPTLWKHCKQLAAKTQKLHAPTTLYERPKKSMVKKDSKFPRKQNKKRNRQIPTPARTTIQAVITNPNPIQRAPPKHELFVDLVEVEKKRRAVKAKMSAKSRKKKRIHNERNQKLLTEYVHCEPKPHQRHMRRKRQGSVNTVHPKKPKKIKKGKSSESVRSMLQKSEGDPKATRGG